MGTSSERDFLASLTTSPHPLSHSTSITLDAHSQTLAPRTPFAQALQHEVSKQEKDLQCLQSWHSGRCVTSGAHSAIHAPRTTNSFQPQIAPRNSANSLPVGLRLSSDGYQPLPTNVLLSKLSLSSPPHSSMTSSPAPADQLASHHVCGWLVTQVS